MEPVYKLAKRCVPHGQDLCGSTPTGTDNKIKNIHLYLKVSQLSDTVMEDGQWIQEWEFYGPPSASTLKWPKRRHPLEQNWKLWRNTIKQIFYGAQGLFPTRLEAMLSTPEQGSMVQTTPLFSDTLLHYSPRYKAILGDKNRPIHRQIRYRHYCLEARYMLEVMDRKRKGLGPVPTDLRSGKRRV